jgi:flagellar basal body P-ring formation protein FlgA
MVIRLAFTCLLCALTPVWLAAQTVQAPAPIRAIMAGEVLDDSSITLKPFEQKSLFSNTVKGMNELAGMVAAKPLRAGLPINRLHIKPATAVNNGDLISLIYTKPGLQLTTSGKALADGQVGETIKVLNTSTRSTVLATITGAGTAQLK